MTGLAEMIATVAPLIVALIALLITAVLGLGIVAEALEATPDTPLNGLRI